MRLAMMFVLVVAACGGGGGPGPGDDTPADPDAEPAEPDAPTAATWGETVDDYIHVACVEIEACGPPVPPPPPNCEADLTADFADAMAALDDAGEQRCIHCLQVKLTTLREIIANDCGGTTEQVEAVFAACDLDPTVDYDGDGTVDNDHDEACAGFP